MKQSLLLATLSFALMAAPDDAGRRRSGHYEVILRPPADGLFAREEMEIEVRIEDTRVADGQGGFAPLVRASVEATIDMPSMPGMPVYRETAHPEAVPGEYGVHPTFVHGGEYRMRLAITPPQAPPFTVEFALAVRDAASDRKPKPQRYSVELTTAPKRPKAGEPAELRFVFRDRENPKTPLTTFEIMHEALFHLIMVRTDLGWFEHVHPTLDPDGVFRLRHTFATGGDYRLFADVAPKGAGAQNLMAKLAVSGVALPEPTRANGRTTIAVAPPEGGISPRKTNRLSVTITDAASGVTPADLEPYLGAAGHCMLVHEDAVTFVHSHPTDDTNALRSGGLEFLARLPKPGAYRGWIQVKRGGEIVTSDFRIRAADAP